MITGGVPLDSTGERGFRTISYWTCYGNLLRPEYFVWSVRIIKENGKETSVNGILSGVFEPRWFVDGFLGVSDTHFFFSFLFQ